MAMENEPKVRVDEKRSAWIDFPDGRKYFRTRKRIWMVPETGSNQMIVLNDSKLIKELNILAANVIGETRFIISQA